MAIMPDWALDQANHLTGLADAYDRRVLLADLHGDVETLRHARRVRDALDYAASQVLRVGTGQEG